MLVAVQLYLNIQRLGQVVGEREVKVAAVWESVEHGAEQCVRFC